MQYLSNHRRTESSFLHRCFFPSLMGNCVDCVIDINTAAGRMIVITEFYPPPPPPRPLQVTNQLHKYDEVHTCFFEVHTDTLACLPWFLETDAITLVMILRPKNTFVQDSLSLPSHIYPDPLYL